MPFSFSAEQDKLKCRAFLSGNGVDILLYQYFVKPVFFRMDPEKAHHLVIDGLHQAVRVPGMTGVLQGMYGVPDYPELQMDLLGLSFRHPVGLAAGLDKNAKSVAGFSSVGFGFMEVGTVTPLPQL